MVGTIRWCHIIVTGLNEAGQVVSENMFPLKVMPVYYYLTKQVVSAPSLPLTTTIPCRDPPSPQATTNLPPFPPSHFPAPLSFGLCLHAHFILAPAAIVACPPTLWPLLLLQHVHQHFSLCHLCSTPTNTGLCCFCSMPTNTCMQVVMALAA